MRGNPSRWFRRRFQTAAAFQLAALAAAIAFIALDNDLLGEEHVWHDKSGNVLMSGEFDSFPDDLVWVVKPDGSRASIPFRQLGAEDRKFVMYRVLGLKQDSALPAKDGADADSPAQDSSNPSASDQQAAEKPLELLPEPKAKAIQPAQPVPSPADASILPANAEAEVGNSPDQVEDETSKNASGIMNEESAKVSTPPSTLPDEPAALPKAAAAPPSESAGKQVAKREEPSPADSRSEQSPIRHQSSVVNVELNDRTGRIAYRLGGEKFTAHLAAKDGLYPAHFKYYQSLGSDRRVRSWAIARDAEQGEQYAVWYESDSGWVLLSRTKRIVPRVVARPSLNPPLLIAPLNSQPVPNESSLEPIAESKPTYYRGLSSQTSINPLKVNSTNGPEPKLFQYFIYESGHPEVRKWALSRNPEHGGLFGLWYERAGLWHFYDWTTKVAQRND